MAVAEPHRRAIADGDARSHRHANGDVPARGRRIRRRAPAGDRGRLDEPLSRWLWLVKWLLAVPHVVMLLFLWLAFAVLTLVTLVVRLITGRYLRERVRRADD